VAAQEEDTELVSACSMNVSDPDAPVIAPLIAAFGVGNMLFPSEASTSLTNLNGDKLSEARFATKKCPAMQVSCLSNT
jgi:hypothetical protein